MLKKNSVTILNPVGILSFINLGFLNLLGERISVILFQKIYVQNLKRWTIRLRLPIDNIQDFNEIIIFKVSKVC